EAVHAPAQEDLDQHPRADARRFCRSRQQRRGGEAESDRGHARPLQEDAARGIERHRGYLAWKAGLARARPTTLNPACSEAVEPTERQALATSAGSVPPKMRWSTTAVTAAASPASALPIRVRRST